MIKRLILLVLLSFCVCAAAGKTLPLSAQGKEESLLYLDFMQAVRAELWQKSDACSFYQKAFARAPQSKYLRRILMVCSLGKDLAQAEQYASYINEGENDGEDWAVYAFYQWRKGNLKEARQCYENALEKSPEDPRFLFQYISLLTSVEPDEAVQNLQNIKAEYPSISHVIDYETGNLYRSQKQLQEALKYYNLATKANPQYADPYLARADIYEKKSQFFLMLHELEALEKTGYESAAMYSRMGSVYLLGKDNARAKEYFLKAKTLDNADIPAGYFLALYAEKDGDFASAAQYLQEMSDFQTNAAIWLQAAFYRQLAGDASAALKTLKEAYERFDQNVEIGYFYALALQDAGQNRQSARVLRGVLETNPDYEQARLAYAFVLESLHKYGEMEKQVRRVLEQNPRSAAAYNLLGFSLADRNKRLEEALEFIIKALEISPDDRAFADSLAWVYYRMGEYDRALGLLENLGEDFLNSTAEAAYHLGAVYFTLGEGEKALPWLEKAAAGGVKPAVRLLKKLPRAQK